MPKKQEQLPAEAGITEVGPAVLRVQLPIRFTGLGHVNMYVLEDEHGAAVIDPGLPTRSSWNAAKRGLAEAGIPLRRIHRVYVTHSHPDHFGGVAKLVRKTGAEMVAHEHYRAWWQRHAHSDLAFELSETEIDEERRAWTGIHPWDDPDDVGSLRTRLKALGPKSLVLGAVRTPEPTTTVTDGQIVRLAGREWQAVHTPGHTGDHLCLFDLENGLVITGDHVLPSITPHVSGVGAGLDPLGNYLASLRKVVELPGLARALPAHGGAFDDVPGRIGEIEAHHEKRIAQIVALGEHPVTAREYARQLYPERLWGFLAESETYAHLAHLEHLGRVKRLTGDGAPRFVVTE